MTKPRNIWVPRGSMRAFHVVTRCARREFLLEAGRHKRVTQGLAWWLSHAGLAGKHGSTPADLARILDRIDFIAQTWVDAMARCSAMLGAALGAPVLRQDFPVRTGIAWCADPSRLRAE